MSPTLGAALEPPPPCRPGDRDEPAHALRDDVERGPLRIRTRAGARIAEAANRRIDERRIDSRAAARSRRPARSITPVFAFSTTASAVSTSLKNVVAVRVGLEVEHDAALVAIDAREVAAVVASFSIRRETAPVAAAHVAGRRLDLDDVGAEVGQQHRAVRTGERLREIEHANVGERTGARGHRLPQ